MVQVSSPGGLRVPGGEGGYSRSMTEVAESAASGRFQRIRSNLQRLEPPRRIPGVDLARGLAVIGMFAAHLMWVPHLVWSQPETWLGIVEGRSAITFATLAGVSLGLMTTNPDGARTRISIRAAVIWLLGLVLLALAVPVYVVLPAYGVLLLLGALLVGWRTRTLLVLIAVMVVVGPLIVFTVESSVTYTQGSLAEGLFFLFGWNYPFAAWIVFLAAGLVAGRVIRGGNAHVTALVAVGVGLALLGYGLIGPVGNAVVATYGEDLAVGSRPWALSVLQDAPHSSGIGEVVGSGGFALLLIAGCVLACATPLSWLLWPVRAVGSMPLTAYTAHLVVWAIWAALTPGLATTYAPLAAFRELEPFWPMTLGVGAGCVAWTLLMGQGPLERLVQYLSEVADTSAGRDLR